MGAVGPACAVSSNGHEKTRSFVARSSRRFHLLSCALYREGPHATSDLPLAAAPMDATQQALVEIVLLIALVELGWPCESAVVALGGTCGCGPRRDWLWSAFCQQCHAGNFAFRRDVSLAASPEVARLAHIRNLLATAIGPRALLHFPHMQMAMQQGFPRDAVRLLVTHSDTTPHAVVRGGMSPALAGGGISPPRQRALSVQPVERAEPATPPALLVPAPLTPPPQVELAGPAPRSPRARPSPY